MAQIKRGRGRPPKTDPNSVESIEKRIREQQMKFGAKVADNLDALMNEMMDIALKDKVNGERPSMTNKMSAIRWCVSFAEDFLKEDEKSDESGSSETALSKEDNTSKPLISLAYNGD